MTDVQGVTVRRQAAAETSAALLLAVALVASQWSSLLAARWTLRALPVWAVLLFLALPKQSRGHLRLPLSLTAFVGWCLASHAWSSDPGNSTRRLTDVVALVVVGWLTGQVLGTRGAIRTLSRTVRYVLVVSAATLVVAPHWASAPAADGALGWHGPFPHKNGLGFFCAFAILTLWSAMPPGRGRRLWLGLALILLVGSRSASPLGALVVAAVFMVWQAARSEASVRRRLAVDSTAVGLLAALGTVALLWPNVFFAALGRDSSLTGRRAVWTAVEHWIGKRPITGFGFGGVWENPSPVTLALWRESQFDVFYAHNGYLDIWLQVGLIGLVLLVAVLVGLGVATIRPGQQGGQWPLGVLVVLLLTAISESAPFTGNGLLLLALLVGCVSAPAAELRVPPAEADAATSAVPAIMGTAS